MRPKMDPRKRALDLALLLPTLPVFLPLGLGLALAARLSQGGPIFFRQERVGYGGLPFQVLKIRTMTTEPDPADRRVTAFGRWARARGVDELPQLINVLVGEMSLVGPRPLSPDDFQRLSAVEPAIADRVKQPPGLTGLAQACQARGPAENARLDSIYAQAWSPLLVVEILLRTVWINLVGKARGRWSPAAAEARLGRG